MTATIVPFPLVCRAGYIARQAEQMASMSEEAAARYLGRQVKVQTDAMRRRGVAEALIVREVKRMEAAIRREFEAMVGEGIA